MQKAKNQKMKLCYLSKSNRVISKQFEIAELKLLVDAIQSSKFNTQKKFNVAPSHMNYVPILGKI